MTVTTFSIASSADDNMIEYTGATYPPASGPTTYPSDVGVYMYRSLLGATYYTALGLLRWNTASIPDGDTVSAALLRVVPNGRDSPNGLKLCADWQAWTGVTADWTNSTLSGALTDYDYSALPLGVSVDIPLSGYATGVSKSGTTYLRLGLTQRALDAAPTGDNVLHVASFDHDTLAEPKLVVTHAPAGTLQRLAPDAILTGGGTVADVQDDPDAFDGVWLDN